MAYNKTTWVNGTTAVNATNMDHIETGIYDNSTNIGELSNLDTTANTNIVSAINEVNTSTNNIGKLLWNTGNFTSGTITVTGISAYKIIIVVLDAGEGVCCLGNQHYGGNNIGEYSAYSTAPFGYRFAYNSNDETLTINGTTDRGGINGGNGQQVPIKEIYGLI